MSLKIIKLNRGKKWTKEKKKIVCHPINWCHCKGLSFYENFKCNVRDAICRRRAKESMHDFRSSIQLCFSQSDSQQSNPKKIKSIFDNEMRMMEWKKVHESSRPFNMFILLNSRYGSLSSFNFRTKHLNAVKLVSNLFSLISRKMGTKFTMHRQQTQDWT